MTTPHVSGYVDIEPIGRGGVGDVFRARRVSTGGLVALKVIRNVGDASAARRRIDREVAALLALKGHPNVVHVEEIVHAPEGPVMVMEHVGRGSLADRLAARGPLPPAEVALVGLHVATALRDAHERGILHRDVKPQNLLVGDFGQVKLCDFGIAALTRGAPDRTGALSYRYASPEELADDPTLGPAADVYSLGVTLRHLATGSPRVDASVTWVAGSRDAERFVARNTEALVGRMTMAEPSHRPTAADVARVCVSFEHELGPSGMRALVEPAPEVEPEPAAADDATVRRDRRLPRPNQAPVEWWEAP